MTIHGTDGDDTFAITTPIPFPISLIAGAGNDRLEGPAAGTTWSITGPGTGSIGPLSFSGFEDLTGAAGNEDTFIFEAAGSLTGTVEGGDGGYDVIVVAAGGSPLASSITGPQSGTLMRGADVITYAGMEPVTVVGTTAIVITAPDNATIVIAESGTASDKTFSINFNGGGETHLITAADTVTSLVLNLGAGTNLVTLEALDSRVRGVLTINGGGGATPSSSSTRPGAGRTPSTAAAAATPSRPAATPNMALTNSQLTVGTDVIQLSGVENATLAGGAGDNTFTLGELRAGRRCCGGAANDRYVFGAGPMGAFFLDETGGGVDTSTCRPGRRSRSTSRERRRAVIDSAEDHALLRQRLRERRRAPGADTIAGNELDNVFTGGAGDDTLAGDYGDDTYVLTERLGRRTRSPRAARGGVRHHPTSPR